MATTGALEMGISEGIRADLETEGGWVWLSLSPVCGWLRNAVSVWWEGNLGASVRRSCWGHGGAWLPTLNQPQFRN